MLWRPVVGLVKPLNILEARDDALLTRCAPTRLRRLYAHAKLGQQFVV